jgi:phosphate transport system permease protein
VTDVAARPQAQQPLFDPTAPLGPTGNLRRRMLVSNVVTGGATSSAAIAVLVLALVVYTVVNRGASVLSLKFFTTNPVGLVGGGIANYIVGSALIVAVATVIALPVGVLCGLYLTEVAGPRTRASQVLTFVLDLMQGLPTVVAGIFAFGLLVKGHKDSGFAASVALAIVMLPLIARSSQAVLAQVPSSLREAADALGVRRWRTILGVILPSALGGIATGTILAIARAAGETAPVLITDDIFNPTHTQVMIFGHGVPSIPMLILTTSDEAIPSAFARAWGAALALLFVILLANVAARVVLARSRAKMGQ